MKFLKAANIVQIRGFSCKKYSKYTFVFFFSECLKFFFPVWRVGVSIFLPVVKSFSQCLPGAVRSYRYILDIMYIDCISIYIYMYIHLGICLCIYIYTCIVCIVNILILYCIAEEPRSYQRSFITTWKLGPIPHD